MTIIVVGTKYVNCDHFLKMVKPYLARQDTFMRKSLSIEKKIVVSLRYLATGRNTKDLRFSIIDLQLLSVRLMKKTHNNQIKFIPHGELRTRDLLIRS